MQQQEKYFTVPKFSHVVIECGLKCKTLTLKGTMHFFVELHIYIMYPLS
jgi:hypothetical protein